MLARRLVSSIAAALALTISTIGTALAQPKPIPNCPAGYLRWSFTDSNFRPKEDPEKVPLYESTHIDAKFAPKSITVEILYPAEICMSHLGNPCSEIVDNPGWQTDNPLILRVETGSETYDGKLNRYTRNVFITVENPRSVRLLENFDSNSQGSPKHGCYKVSMP